MTRYTLLFCLCLITCISACRKKAECDGTVFSKHGIPMPKLPMLIEYRQSGKNPVVDYYSVSTDTNGHFSFSEKIPRKRKLERIIVTAGDSGSFRSDGKPTRNMEIMLQ